MKSLMSLWMVLAQDMGQRCSVDTTRDIQTVSRRVKNEGWSFMSITLPSFGKAFESWLDQGTVDLALTPGFRSRRGLPAFLSGFLEQIFTQDGVILETPSVDCILAIRQLCGQYGKMFLSTTVEREQKAMLGYLSTDEELYTVEQRMLEGPFHEELLALRRIFTMVYSGVLDHCNNSVAYGEVTPRHGPGATADRLTGNSKWRMNWHTRLEEFFKADEFLTPNPRYAYSMLGKVTFLEPGDELPVRVICVPKTAKSPRIIAIEPTCMQYAQQALAGVLTKRVNEDDILKRFIGFSDQERNQFLAREGSLTGTLATLDLSEASDRLSNYLVRFLLDQWTYLSGSIQACRSTHAEVRIDDTSTIRRKLTKFASMGSALTFPLETMVFFAIVLRGVEKSVGRRLSLADVVRLAGQVSVYGDDIICPTDHVGSIVHELESFGFKVNSSKSFWNGNFRESCGKDYYRGFDVSYIKFRKEWPDDRRNVAEVVSLVSYFNQAKDAHYVNTTSWLRKELRRILGENNFPRVSRDSEILGEYDDVYHDIVRLCDQTHRPLSRGWVVKTHIPENPLDGELALLKWFLKEGSDPLSKDHLRRSGRSSTVSIKLRMRAT